MERPSGCVGNSQKNKTKKKHIIIVKEKEPAHGHNVHTHTHTRSICRLNRGAAGTSFTYDEERQQDK